MPADSYPFAVGRIRGLERSYLDAAAFHRLAEQPIEQAVKSLADSGYGQEAANKSDPDALIDAEMQTLRELIEELTPDKRLTDLFWLEQDATNLKLLLKARMLGDEVEDSAFAKGLFDIETLRAAVEEKDYTAFPANLAESLSAVEQMIDKRESTQQRVDPLTVSAEVDKAVYGYIFSELKKTRNKFIASYFGARVDFTNVLSLLRARALKWDRAKFSAVFVPGGEVKEKDLLEVYDLPVDNIERAVDFGTQYSAIRQGLSAYMNERGSVAAAAEVYDRKLMDVAGEERYDSFGIGPIVYYLLRKADEGKQLQVLFAKKRAAEAAGR